MLGRGEDAFLRSELDDLAEIHDGNPMGHVLDDGEIMADEEERKAELALQILQQVHDLRLDGNIERRDRLVAHDEIGFSRERARNGGALAPSAGALVRAAPPGLVWPGQRY